MDGLDLLFDLPYPSDNARTPSLLQKPLYLDRLSDNDGVR